MYYDNILLSVLAGKKIPARDIFTLLFQKNNTRALLAFLNEESSLKEDLGILNSVPRVPFMLAAFKKLM